MQPPIFEMTLETVHVFDKPCTVTALPASWQLMFTKMQQNMGVTFHPGIPTIPWEEVFPPEQCPSLLVLDDLMRETVDSDQVMDLLSKKAHHLNLFVIVVTQNLYALGKHSIGMNRNYQYTILFRNPADTCYIKTLGHRWVGETFYASVRMSHYSALWVFSGGPSPTNPRGNTLLF